MVVAVVMEVPVMAERRQELVRELGPEPGAERFAKLCRSIKNAVLQVFLIFCRVWRARMLAGIMGGIGAWWLLKPTAKATTKTPAAYYWDLVCRRVRAASR